MKTSEFKYANEPFLYQKLLQTFSFFTIAFLAITLSVMTSSVIRKSEQKIFRLVYII